MSNAPPFPTVIDNSLVEAFIQCPTKCFNEYFSHWKLRTPNVHLHAGGAYAHGMEAARLAFFRDGVGETEAIARGMKALIEFYGDFECPPESGKSLEGVLGAFQFYHDRYPMSKDSATPMKLAGGKIGVEFNFVEPLDVDHPETGAPLLYTGRFDGLMDYQSSVFGLDDKTTTQLGAGWARKWDLRSQFTGYCWGARKARIPIVGFLVRGVSILKTKFDTQQAITYRQDWQIDEWYENLTQRILPRMIEMWGSHHWTMALGDACEAYGGCPFRPVCLAEPSNRISWLETKFERRAWDPVTRKETLL